jgi:lipopolysaccharide transport system permease protein
MMLRHLARLRHYGDLLLTLMFRDIQVRYKQTFLGMAWAIAQPLAFMVILTAVKAVIFRETDSEGVPHPVFLYSAMVPWIFFQSSINFATNSISGNMNLVKKIYFPREIFPLASVLACLVDFLIASLVFVGMLVYYRIAVTSAVLWVPVLALTEILFVLGLGMFLAASNVFYRDIKYVVPLAVQMLFFASPIFYSVDLVPEHLRPWYMLNPLAVVIDGYRRTVLHGLPPELGPLAASVGIAVGVCLLSYKYLKHCEGTFADLI